MDLQARISFEPIPLQGGSAIPSDAAVELALARGYQPLRLDWCGLFEQPLWVEDDLRWILEANETCPTAEGKHHVFLGDGAIVIAADVSDVATIRVEHTPFLRKGLTKSHSQLIPADLYRAGWHRVALSLSSQILGSQD